MNLNLRTSECFASFVLSLHLDEKNSENVSPLTTKEMRYNADSLCFGSSIVDWVETLKNAVLI